MCRAGLSGGSTDGREGTGAEAITGGLWPASKPSSNRLEISLSEDRDHVDGKDSGTIYGHRRRGRRGANIAWGTFRSYMPRAKSKDILVYTSPYISANTSSAMLGLYCTYVDYITTFAEVYAADLLCGRMDWNSVGNRSAERRKRRVQDLALSTLICRGPHPAD